MLLGVDMHRCRWLARASTPSAGLRISETRSPAITGPLRASKVRVEPEVGCLGVKRSRKFASAVMS